MTELIDQRELAQMQYVDLLEGGEIWIHDNATCQDIKLDAKSAMKLAGFLLLHQERLSRHAQAESEQPKPARLARPPYYVGSPGDEQGWWRWADQASDQELLEALHGCASWADIAAHVCLTRLKDRGYTLYNSATPASVTIEKAGG